MGQVLSDHSTDVQTRVKNLPHMLCIYCTRPLNLLFVDSVKSVNCPSECFAFLEAL